MSIWELRIFSKEGSVHQWNAIKSAVEQCCFVHWIDFLQRCLLCHCIDVASMLSSNSPWLCTSQRGWGGNKAVARQSKSVGFFYPNSCRSRLDVGGVSSSRHLLLASLDWAARAALESNREQQILYTGFRPGFEISFCWPCTGLLPVTRPDIQSFFLCLNWAIEITFLTGLLRSLSWFFLFFFACCFKKTLPLHISSKYCCLDEATSAILGLATQK